MANDWIIRDFTPDDAPDFAALNRRWIDELFGVEDEDLRQLEQPMRTIIEPGGFIAIAEMNETVIGTGAILPSSHTGDDGDMVMEVVKMATAPAAQGKGIGAAILDRLIAFARAHNASAIWLETNDRLEAATALYERKGFVRLSPADAWATPYDRCNLQMMLTFPTA